MEYNDTLLAHGDDSKLFILDKKYILKDILGEGGMGKVYTAVRIDSGRQVAIKVLLPQWTNDKEMLRRFRQEAQAAGTIESDYICDILDMGHDSEHGEYIVMPLLFGSPFSDLLKQQKLSTPELIDILIQTLHALEAAHERNIIHRDLKPDNIFITKMGDRNNFVKLLDFGIAKFLDNDDSIKTQTGMMMGTPYYMAPEQIAASKDVSGQIDLYAVGAILYQGLTGRTPYQGNTPAHIIANIMTQEFLPPRSINPAIPKQVEEIINKAMARNPNDRYASASEMITALTCITHIEIPSAPVTITTTADETPHHLSAKPISEIQRIKGQALNPNDTSSSSNSIKSSSTGYDINTLAIQTAALNNSKTLLYAIIGLATIIVLFAAVVLFVLSKKDENKNIVVPPVITQPQTAITPVQTNHTELKQPAENNPIIETEIEPETDIKKTMDTTIKQISVSTKRKDNNTRPKPSKVEATNDTTPVQPVEKNKKIEGRFGTSIPTAYE
ncbi:MAG: serine/threonine protein kinase, partial [Deltaproteobacteria bacterium]|nr:serine/threonine protein kinase [Deltaproteobacteria bacterium]